MIDFYDAIRRGGLKKCSDGVRILREDYKKYQSCADRDTCCMYGLFKSSFQGNRKQYIGDKNVALKGQIAGKKLKKDLPKYERLLRKSYLSANDFEETMKRWDSETAFFFLDPPWESKFTRFYKEKQIEPRRVAKVVQQMKGKVLVIYDLESSILKEFKGKKGLYCYRLNATAHDGHNVGGYKMKERLVVTNWKVR